ncbi:rhodanese-like domain-containing protein [Vibrio sp. RC27]
MKSLANKILSGLTLFLAVFSANAASERGQTAWEWIEQGATILDVRTPSEFASGHIENSHNLPLQEIPSHLTKLDKSLAYVVYCRSGNRSGQAYKLLKQAGFEKVHNGGGINEMRQSKPQ